MNYVYPPKCIFCGEITGSTDVCLNCWKRVTWISQERCCNICGQPFKYKMHDICKECLLDPPLYDKAISVFLYNNFSKTPILNLKNRDATYLAATFSSLIFRNIKKYINAYDMICPVPIHRKKFMKRMYNQSGLLALELSKLCNLRYDPLILEKTKQTLAQEGLSRELRLKNVVGSFSVINKECINGKSIILVDDVITTGATVNECAKELKAAGANKVLVATIAKVVVHKFCN